MTPPESGPILADEPQLLSVPSKLYVNGSAAPTPGLLNVAVPCSEHSPPPGAAIDGAATIAPPATAIAAPATRDSLPNLRMRAPSEFRRRAGSTDDATLGRSGGRLPNGHPARNGPCGLMPDLSVFTERDSPAGPGRRGGTRPAT